MKQKNILSILIILAIVAIVAFFAYQFLYRNSAATPGIGQTGTLPIAANQQFSSSSQSGTATSSGLNPANASSSSFGLVSNDPALDYFVDAANTVTLIEPNGTIESISNNTTTILSTSTISDIINASFSYNGKQIMITSRAGATTQTVVFNTSSRTFTLLQNDMQSPVWSPTNDKIAYLIPAYDGTESLNMIDLGAAIAKPITISTLSMEDLSLQWPSKNTIIISDRPSAFVPSSIWKFNIPSQTLSLVVYENYGTESAWSPSGSALLFLGGANNAGGRLLYQDAAGNQQTLAFDTLPSKCVFTPIVATSSISSSSAMFYCAAPADQNTFFIVRLPDEYDQKVYFSNDNFYSVNVGTEALNEIFSYTQANMNIDATDLKIFNNVLFFINRYDQKLYALSL
jgi:hypothetical protein